MYLRAGIHLTISSPISATSSCVQMTSSATTATTTYLNTTAQDVKSSSFLHDHCQFTSFTDNLSRRGRDSCEKMTCSSSPSSDGKTILATETTSLVPSPLSEEKLAFSLQSSTGWSTDKRMKMMIMGGESSRNNNSPFYFLQNCVQRQQGHHLPLYQSSGSSSSIQFPNFSSYSHRVFERFYLGGGNTKIYCNNNKATMSTSTGNRHFSTVSSGGKDNNSGGGSKGSNDDGSCSSSSSSSNSIPFVVTIKDGLKTPESATDFLDQLSEHQRQLIYHTLNIEHLRDKYEGHLGSSSQESHFFLSKFGRPATAKEDPTGTLCEVSPKWLHARLDEKAPPAPPSAIWAVVLKNALPFIGFGFLDNLIMILAGDYIDMTIGTALGISTMAAAALGNAISDVAGIGSAWYVESFASKIGIRDPDLTPSQMASSSVRWACNFGRAFGVAIGCILGMFPLLFLPSADEVKDRRPSKKDSKGDSDAGVKR